MPSPEVLVSFKEGLGIIQNVTDFATLRHTIDSMISICPPDELPMAKDAIARVIRVKQAAELRNHEGFPQAIAELDKKYRDLYIVLRTSKSNMAPVSGAPAQVPKPENQMAKIRGLGGLNMPMMLLNWLRSKRKYLIAGGAVGAVGGAYMLYKQLTGEKSLKPKEDKDSNFDKTIKSIQKYKAFTQMMNNPDFSGDYTDILNGNVKSKKLKRKDKVKKEDVNKSIEWDKDERSLMKDMDDAFNVIATKPELDYQLPQLPAPKNIDPKEVIGEDKPIELSSISSSKQKMIKSEPKTRKPRKPRKSRKTTEDEPQTETFAEEVAPVEEKVRKVRRKKVLESEPGRLIPIVKRTKRVKRVNT